MSTESMQSRVVLVPIGDRIIVKQDESVEETGGGIVIPEAHREKPLRGCVVAIGSEGVKVLKPGDQVLFSAFAGAKLTHQDVEYLIMREDDVLCVERRGASGAYPPGSET